MDRQIPIVLLTGVSADARLFAPQLEAFPNLMIQPWIPPRDNEPLRSYAARLAAIMSPREPHVIGGASFGGIVALELAALLRPKACLLISSLRSPQEMPWWGRLARPLGALTPRAMAKLAGILAQCCSPILSRRMAHLLHSYSGEEKRFARWANWAVLRWRGCNPSEHVKVLRIHGDCDRTLPLRDAHFDVVVKGGGHLLPLTHPSAVNDLLRFALDCVA